MRWELHAKLLLLWFHLYEDSLCPCTLRHFKYLVSVVYLFVIHTARFVQTVGGQGSGGDVKSTLDNVSDALRQRVPSTSKVASKHFAQFGSRDMCDILIAQVGHPCNRTFLDGPYNLVFLVKCDNGYLVSHLLVFALEQCSIVLQFFQQECRLDYFHIFPDVFLCLGILFNTIQHAENVIFLNIPHITLRECLQADSFFVAFLFHVFIIFFLVSVEFGCKCKYFILFNQDFTHFFWLLDLKLLLLH